MKFTLFNWRPGLIEVVRISPWLSINLRWRFQNASRPSRLEQWAAGLDHAWNRSSRLSIHPLILYLCSVGSFSNIIMLIYLSKVCIFILLKEKKKKKLPREDCRKKVKIRYLFSSHNYECSLMEKSSRNLSTIEIKSRRKLKKSNSSWISDMIPRRNEPTEICPNSK